MSRHTLMVLAGVLVLDWADRNIVGGLAPELQRELHISNSQLGLLAASFSIVGGVASLPLGRLVDRVRRLALLAGAVALWSLAMLAVGAAQSFLWLFGARLLLGAIAATAGPATPSLVGDLVPDSQRARVLGFIDSGQLLGTGVGYVLSAFVVAYLSWRWGFWLLAAPGALVVFLLHRSPEPTRTQQRRTRAVSYLQALRTVVTIRTNVIVVIAASVGNLFFATVSTFAVVFATQQYGLTTSQADLGVLVVAVGAVTGILGGGRLGDRLVRRGVQTGRLWVAAVGLVAAAALGTPVLFLHSLPLAALLVTVGTGALNAATPTLDAVRLDVVPAHLRGRAESLRTVIRTLVEGFAPLVIGVLADHLAGGGHAGLRWALVLVMPALALNGVLLLFAMRTYPREAAAVSGQRDGM
jgi:MFS family permease